MFWYTLLMDTTVKIKHLGKPCEGYFVKSEKNLSCEVHCDQEGLAFLTGTCVRARNLIIFNIFRKILQTLLTEKWLRATVMSP